MHWPSLLESGGAALSEIPGQRTGLERRPYETLAEEVAWSWDPSLMLEVRRVGTLAYRSCAPVRATENGDRMPEALASLVR